MSVDPLRSGLIFSFRPLDSSTNNPASSIPVRNFNIETPGFHKEGFGSTPQSNNYQHNADKAASSSVKDIFEKLYRATPLPAILTGKTPTSNNAPVNQSYYASVTVPQSQSHYLNSVTKRIDYGGEVVRESPQQPYLTPAVMPPPSIPSRTPQSATFPIQSSASTPLIAGRPTAAEQPLPVPPRVTTSECSVQTMPTIPEETEESPPNSPIRKSSSAMTQTQSIPPSSHPLPKTTPPPPSNIVIASPPAENIRPSTDLVTNIYQQVMAKLAQDVAQHLISPRIVSTIVEQQLSTKLPQTDLLSQLNEQIDTDPIVSSVALDDRLNEPEPLKPEQAPPIPKKTTRSSKPPLPPPSSADTIIPSDRRTRAVRQQKAPSLLTTAEPSSLSPKSLDGATSQSGEESSSDAKAIKRRKPIPATVVSSSLLGIAAEERKKPEVASSSSVSSASSQLGKRSRTTTNSLLAIATSSINSEEDTENTETNFIEEKKQRVESAPKRRMQFSSALLSTLIEPGSSSPAKAKPSAVFVNTTTASPSPTKAKRDIPTNPIKAHSPVPSSSSSSEEEEEDTVKRGTRNQKPPTRKEPTKPTKDKNPPQRSSRPVKKAVVSSETSSSSSEKELNEQQDEEQAVEYHSPQRGHRQDEMVQSQKSTKQTKTNEDPLPSITSTKEIKQRANEFIQMKESLLLLSQQTASPSPKKASISSSSSSSLLQTASAGPWRQHELIALYAAHGKTDVRKANFWDIISQKLREGGIDRSKEECEQQWFRHLQQTEERKANNLKKKKESQTTKAMEKFDSLLQQNQSTSKSNGHGRKRKQSRKEKEVEERNEEEGEEEEPSEEKVLRAEEEEKETSQPNRKKPRILKKDLELIAQKSALATKHDDIFESEQFRKQLQTGHRASFSSNLLQNITSSISSPKISSPPVAPSRTRGRRYSEKNLGKGRRDKDKDYDEQDEDDEEEEEEEENSEKEEIQPKSRGSKRTTSSVASSSARHGRSYGGEEENESLFKKQHIQKINKTRIQPQLLVSYSTNDSNSSKSKSKSTNQKGGKKGATVENSGGAGGGFGGSSSLLSSLYSQNKITDRLDQRDFVKQQNDEFNQKLKKSFQQMSKLKKREEEEGSEDEEESIEEEDSDDLVSEED